MKRKRKDLEFSVPKGNLQSPKKLKVHAQRKFAQGSCHSTVSSPVLEFQPDRPDTEAVSDPVELFPMKQPNTQDFLTFLCFRNTPLLPPSLNFFNKASIVDHTGQVHAVKSEIPLRNGPIDTSGMKSNSDKPFVAFGVRKRADPVVISKQMERKRRHALALQALRRKYQEQKMAKIRAITISKLSEKSPSSSAKPGGGQTKIPVPQTKSIVPLQKPQIQHKFSLKNKLQMKKVHPSPHAKPKMCLRSFRGRFVQKELQFKHVKKIMTASDLKRKRLEERNKRKELFLAKSQANKKEQKPLEVPTPVKSERKGDKQYLNIATKSSDLGYRVTRSGKRLFLSSVKRRQKIKQHMLLSTTTTKQQQTTVKPRILRSQTLKNPKILTGDTSVKCSVRKPIPKPINTPNREPIRKQLRVQIQQLKIEEHLKEDTFQKNASCEPVSTSKVNHEKVVHPEKIIQEAVVSLSKMSTQEIATASLRVVTVAKSPKTSPKESPKKRDINNTSRPTRKTKEAAAIYMEILGHKLVQNSEKSLNNETESIDSFPELPNVRKMQEREKELKAKTAPAITKAKMFRQQAANDKCTQNRLKLKTGSKLKKHSIASASKTSADSGTESNKSKKQPQILRKQLQNSRPVDSDSDESFHVKMEKVPQKMLKTRCKDSQSYLFKEFSSSSSEEMDLADIKQRLSAKNEAIRQSVSPKCSASPKLASETKPLDDDSFDESDEEPLSKLTKKSLLVTAPTKLRRECAKRPQNYLPMPSSSDEEIIAPIPTPTRSPPSKNDLDLKDIDRRFGKERVNMSTEQIEKWLKESVILDSDMADNSVASDDQNLNDMISPDDDNLALISKSIPTTDTKRSRHSPLKKKNDDTDMESEDLKKKKIFRKSYGNVVNLVGECAGPMRPISAFSASNESSVYAFDDMEGADDSIGITKALQFRKPQSRRPSSTATSRYSEDDSNDTLKFRKPITANRKKCTSSTNNNNKMSTRDSKSNTVYANNNSSLAQLVDAPTFFPTEKEFQDPLEYIERIRLQTEPFGICRIVPPNAFKPDCKVADDMRFTAYNQYVHKMMHRWGPNFKELMAIKKYLATQNISLNHPPWIGGMEVDLPRLYQTVQSLGGLKEVIEKKRWSRVSDSMKIPKCAQDRVTKLDDIYCKYLLPYDTLSPAEREKLFDEVETDWAKHESRYLQQKGYESSKQGRTSGANESGSNDNEDEILSESSDNGADDECIVKGRSMALNAFYRIARNTMSMWFKTNDPIAEDVEQEFWKHVTEKNYHICVHSGSIDCGTWGYGFSVSKSSPFARHAWNLKVLTNNSGSVLRSMGPVMGVTVPTLHVGMVFTACCWHRDPHRLPWIEYLHTGASKIWYAIPNTASAKFRNVVKSLSPAYCRNNALWLSSDTLMVPPQILVANGISVNRVVQRPGDFVVIFPQVFTSNLCTGYTVSESVYFGPPRWLENVQQVFEELQASCEPPMFSLDRLILSIVSDSARTPAKTLQLIIPLLKTMCERELKERELLTDKFGIIDKQRIPLPDSFQTNEDGRKVKKKKSNMHSDQEYECDICRMNLFVSMVSDVQNDTVFCLAHAIKHLENQSLSSKHCRIHYTYDEHELKSLEPKVMESIRNKQLQKGKQACLNSATVSAFQKNKFSNMPTLLRKQ